MPAKGEADNSSSQPRSTGSRDEADTSASTANVQGGWHADTEHRKSGRMGPRTPMNRPAANSISTKHKSTTTRQTGVQTPRPKRASRAPQPDAQASGMASSATTPCDPTVGSTPSAIGQMGSAPSGASCSIPATSDPPATAAIATDIDGKDLVVTVVCLVYTPAPRPPKSVLRALSRGYTTTMSITSAANVDGEVAGCHIASTTDADTALLGQHTYNRHGPPLAQGEHKLPTDESSTTVAVATDHEDIVAPTTTGVKGVDLNHDTGGRVEDPFMLQPSAYQAVYRDRILTIYEKHNPCKLPEVAGLFAHFQGREESLHLKVCSKCGVLAEPLLGHGHVPGHGPDGAVEEVLTKRQKQQSNRKA